MCLSKYDVLLPPPPPQALQDYETKAYIKLGPDTKYSHQNLFVIIYRLPSYLLKIIFTTGTSHCATELLLHLQNQYQEFLCQEMPPSASNIHILLSLFPPR